MTGDALSVELRVRTPTTDCVDDRPRSVYERLTDLREAGKIADVSVEVWGQQVRARTPTTPADDPLVESARATYEEFEQWARRTGHDLEPAFSSHVQGSLLTDERTEMIRFPVVCLAVYDRDGLRDVVPCSTGSGVRTVDDCLESLRSEEPVGTVTPGEGLDHGDQGAET